MASEPSTSGPGCQIKSHHHNASTLKVLDRSSCQPTNAATVTALHRPNSAGPTAAAPCAWGQFTPSRRGHFKLTPRGLPSTEPCGARQNTTRAWYAVSPPQTGRTTAPTRPSGITTRGITSNKYEPFFPIRGSPSSTCPCARPVISRGICRNLTTSLKRSASGARASGRAGDLRRAGRRRRRANPPHTLAAAHSPELASFYSGAAFGHGTTTLSSSRLNAYTSLSPLNFTQTSRPSSSSLNSARTTPTWPSCSSPAATTLTGAPGASTRGGGFGFTAGAGGGFELCGLGAGLALACASRRSRIARARASAASASASAASASASSSVPARCRFP
jgi:hypothetical protein